MSAPKKKAPHLTLVPALPPAIADDLETAGLEMRRHIGLAKSWFAEIEELGPSAELLFRVRTSLALAETYSAIVVRAASRGAR
jgi:hypothetical protein